jgi:hypothetical protein
MKAVAINGNRILKRKRHIDQWNRIESPEINLYIYSKLNFDKDAKNIQ